MSELFSELPSLALNFIRHSDGGVSEPCRLTSPYHTDFIRHSDGGVSEQTYAAVKMRPHFIRHSDGGVSERTPVFA